jgi:hypothetical protein
MTAMDHVRHLAEEIGPRGSTRTEEAEAARYSARVLRASGLEPVTEPFRSARSAWAPYALFAGLGLVGVLLYWAGGRWGAVIASVLTLLALLSVLLELAFRPNPVRWLLPKGQSQNVWAKIQPRASQERGSSREPGDSVVLLGHLDSHRTPLVFSSDRWLRLFQVLVPVCLLSTVVLIVLFVIGAFASASLWRWLALPFASVLAGLLLITLQADRTPFTEGANDNATGAGVVLSLAARLAQEPPAHTTVWALFSGCEEVGCYGADAFARAHGGELGNAAWIALDGVGSGGGQPVYLERETFLLTARSDPGLIALAERVAARQPELDVRAGVFAAGGYTEGSIGAVHGLRVLTLTSLREGALGEWHRPTDVVANVDPGVVARTEAFLWEVLLEIDKAAAG